MTRLRPAEAGVMVAASAALILPTALSWWPIAWIEVSGFITGGICVWLTVRENVWTWPLGLANNAIFFAMFFASRLYADMSLQVVYFALGIYGWWNWLHGGANRGTLTVTRTQPVEWIALAVALPAMTLGMHQVLVHVNGASPTWDALSTALSLCANYLVTRKRLENWAFWIAADLVYIPLYVSRDLPLTAALYAIFLAMCVAGARAWFRAWRAAGSR